MVVSCPWRLAAVSVPKAALLGARRGIRTATDGTRAALHAERLRLRVLAPVSLDGAEQQDVSLRANNRITIGEIKANLSVKLASRWSTFTSAGST